ncbi:MAG: NTP transferase domain-containing protein [Candidatus Paceibacterota bacterium]|jgi:bifunctional UDP-N-acetylglucosamine pyrophosphorylase/glucosamine-1-phosphate N-acetyltransferase
MNKKDTIKIIILAAGKGTRMKSELPKALVRVKGKAMIRHLLDSIDKSKINSKPVIVVGFEKEKIMAELGPNYDYAVQKELLGTGHAVQSAEELLRDNSAHVLVLYSDSPFVSPETIDRLMDKHLASNKKITMATIKLENFDDWRAFFYKSFSRIIRNENNEIVRDVQFRDTNMEEKTITEVNPCYFIFESGWLWKKLKTLKTDNDQNQYYLTDLIKIAMEEGEKIESVNIDPLEGLSVNSKEELELLEKLK